MYHTGTLFSSPHTNYNMSLANQWGEMVSRAGVGPKPCPINQLTKNLLVEKLNELTSPKIKEAAAILSEKMNNEDGVLAGLQHFFEDLPVDSMVCSIGLIMGKSLLAKFRISPGKMALRGRFIPVSQEVASVLIKDKGSNIRNTFLRRLMTEDRHQDGLTAYGTTVSIV
jgi:hypothetical protein